MCLTSRGLILQALARARARYDKDQALRLWVAFHGGVYVPTGSRMLFTDMTMPVMTGVQLVTEVLRIRSDLPIILATGYHDRLSEQRAHEIGAHSVIEKPYELSLVATQVRAALEERGRS